MFHRYGAVKKAAVAAMVEGPVTAICPASMLQMHPSASKRIQAHPSVTVVIDESAATDMALQDYYETVHPGGADSRYIITWSLHKPRR